MPRAPRRRDPAALADEEAVGREVEEGVTGGQALERALGGPRPGQNGRGRGRAGRVTRCDRGMRIPDVADVFHLVPRAGEALPAELRELGTLGGLPAIGGGDCRG